MAVYAPFEHNNETNEHFIGIYPIGKVVGASLSAPNIMKSLEQYFLDHSIRMSKHDLKRDLLVWTELMWIQGKEVGLNAYSNTQYLT